MAELAAQNRDDDEDQGHSEASKESFESSDEDSSWTSTTDSDPEGVQTAHADDEDQDHSEVDSGPEDVQTAHAVAPNYTLIPTCAASNVANTALDIGPSPGACCFDWWTCFSVLTTLIRPASALGCCSVVYITVTETSTCASPKFDLQNYPSFQTPGVCTLPALPQN
ncbi:uncharacterized protein BDZ99DRAFT_517073 [Mytilinidion resinicola]|uniref:Uncharacterized protein n=1 Tax=Mytilinidion resinicola TaxID=574789 RepID=A0A6A6YZY0_9PEZI|nr:uncharacterized protein BDZ99DRAFT_517073 [Mytilinidion resinicola]KAF2814486.1 hypothetical protein BDZ99DRAFT_517073 [Mytilinidion resinicola]